MPYKNVLILGKLFFCSFLFPICKFSSFLMYGSDFDEISNSLAQHFEFFNENMLY